MVYSLKGDIEDCTFLDVVLFPDSGILAEGLIEGAATSRLYPQRLIDTLLEVVEVQYCVIVQISSFFKFIKRRLYFL